MWPDTIIISVWPSGGSLASWAAASAPLAPARFSTITVWPQAFSSSWPTSRAMMSVDAAGREADQHLDRAVRVALRRGLVGVRESAASPPPAGQVAIHAHHRRLPVIRVCCSLAQSFSRLPALRQAGTVTADKKTDGEGWHADGIARWRRSPRWRWRFAGAARRREHGLSRKRHPHHRAVPARRADRRRGARARREAARIALGQNVIVESRAGAGGATGTGYVAQQPGNGCTLLLAYDTHAVNPVLLNLPFDTATAFKPVVMIGTIPNIIGAHPSQPYKTFAEMVTEAKKEPDRLAYATGGTGTVAHLSMKLIEQHYGMLLRNVPYRGGAPAAADVVAGHVPMMVGSVQALGKFVQDGKVRALVQLGAKRHPHAARHADHGRARHERLQQRVVDGHLRAVGDAGCDRRALPRRSESRAATTPGSSERMASMGVELIGRHRPAELGAFVKAEMARWGDVVKRYNIKAE